MYLENLGRTWGVHCFAYCFVLPEVKDVMKMVASTSDAPGDISQRAAGLLGMEFAWHGPGAGT